MDYNTLKFAIPIGKYEIPIGISHSNWNLFLHQNLGIKFPIGTYPLEIKIFKYTIMIKVDREHDTH